MRAILFRKLVVDGKDYYQLYNEIDNFEPDDRFATFDNRTSKDYFYIDGDGDIFVPEASLLNIYYDDDKLGFTNVTDEETYMKVFNEFKEKFNIAIREIKPLEEVVKTVSKKILFQEGAIAALVHRIYLNQSFVMSDLPIELKKSQKSNILFHGISGSGKKTIVQNLEKELNMPYADISLSSDVKDTLENIINQLLDRSNNPEEASCGVVFIHDNFDDLSNAMGDNALNVVNFLTSQGVINYGGKLIDFRTITFVVLFDDDKNTYSYSEAQSMLDCTYEIATKELTNGEKFQILFSNNGILRYYEKFLNGYGKKLMVDPKCLVEIITKCNKINPSMTALNSIINSIIGYQTFDGINDVIIDKKHMSIFNKVIDDIMGKINADSNNNKKDDSYYFEKKVDEIVKKVKKDVVGQDDSVKMLVHQLVNNIIWANKEDLDNPKNYIKNILIRGKPGTGKTFISNKVLEYLGVPYYIADATEYTEAGYVGKDVEDMLVDLYHAAGDDLEKAERGVLVIDEIDKRASHGGVGHDVSGSGVQEALYKFAEGTIIKINIGNRMNEIPLYFDTSRLTIICSGAFEGIEDYRDERIGKRKVGFGNQRSKEEDIEIIDADYIQYGMKSQFMRRVKHIIELKDPTKEQFIDIMKTSNSSALVIEKNTLADRGIELEYTDDFYSALADKALSMEQGVRGIAKALIKVFQSINFQDIRASEIEKIILDSEVIENPNKVILVERGRQKKLKIK